MSRYKDAVDVRVPFGPWKVMLPDPRRPDAIPNRDAVPPVAESKDWPEFEDWIVPTLRDFYNDAFEHPVHIPAADKEEMLAFLERGPDPAAPPGWIVWEDAVADADAGADGDAGAGADADASAGGDAGAGAAADASAGGDAGAGPGADPGAEAGAAEFPFPVGTWVAFKFPDGTYTGVISKVWNADLCKVEFSDGDTGDYDGDEIHYAVQLYKRDFGSGWEE